MVDIDAPTSFFDQEKFHNYIRALVEDRENGNVDSAFNQIFSARKYLDNAGFPSTSLSYNQNLAVILQHEIICYKHLWQNQRRTSYLDKMKDLCMQGLSLDLDRSQKAVFNLRLGDFHASLGNPVSAEMYYSLAKGDAKPGTMQKAEFLAHWGESLGSVDRVDEGIMYILAAIKEAEKYKHLVEDWHYLVIISGMYGRLAKLTQLKGDRGPTMGYFWQSVKRAIELGVKHHKWQRCRQIYQYLRGQGD